MKKDLTNYASWSLNMDVSLCLVFLVTLFNKIIDGVDSLILKVVYII